MNKTEQWAFEHAGLPVVVKHWGLERGGFEAMNDGKGVWNYYVFLPERLLKEKFADVWLPDERVKWSETGPERITHDYMRAPFADAEWHCGITYYAKHGQLEGHRSVELGCDYSHLYDQERGFDYTLEEVASEAKATAEQLAAIYLQPAP